MNANEVKVYLHNGSSMGEIMENYGVTEAEAENIRNATYEVALIVDKSTGQVVRVA